MDLRKPSFNRGVVTGAIAAFATLVAVVYATSNVPGSFNVSTPGNVPAVAGTVSNVFVPVATATSVTVPFGADTYIASGDPLWVCDHSACGSTFPTGNVSQTGWVFMPGSRTLKTNLQTSTSLIWVYARTQDMVSSTANNIGAFEWYSLLAGQQ